MTRFLMLSMATVAMGTAVAHAASVELKFDINSLTTQNYLSGAPNTPAPFTGAGTGQLVFGSDSNSVVTVTINDSLATAATYASPLFQSLTGTLNYNNGVITGGSVTIIIYTPATSTDSYTFNIVSAAAPGSIDLTGNPAIGVPYVFSANTNSNGYANNGFTDTNGDSKFGTTDISPWLPPNTALPGRFLHFDYSPDANGLDGDTDMEVYIPSSSTSVGETPVPLPGAFWAGLPLLASLGLMAKLRARKAR